MTSDRSAPEPSACQILNFENRTIISRDTANFVKPCFSNIGSNSNYWGVIIFAERGPSVCSGWVTELPGTKFLFQKPKGDQNFPRRQRGPAFLRRQRGVAESVIYEWEN